MLLKLKIPRKYLPWLINSIINKQGSTDQILLRGTDSVTNDIK
jgi:hypothetical protein